MSLTEFEKFIGEQREKVDKHIAPENWQPLRKSSANKFVRFLTDASMDRIHQFLNEDCILRARFEHVEAGDDYSDHINQFLSQLTLIHNIKIQFYKSWVFDERDEGVVGFDLYLRKANR